MITNNFQFISSYEGFFAKNDNIEVSFHNYTPILSFSKDILRILYTLTLLIKISLSWFFELLNNGKPSILKSYINFTFPYAQLSIKPKDLRLYLKFLL